MTNKGKTCFQCNKKLIGAKGPVENFEIKDFGTPEKPDLKMVCSDCGAKFKRAFGGSTV